MRPHSLLAALPLSLALVAAPALSGPGGSLPQAAFAIEATATVIPAGTKVKGKLEEKLDSGTARDGERFIIDLEPGLFGDKALRGDKLLGHLENVQPAHRFGKKGSMALLFDKLQAADGWTYPVDARLLSVLHPQGHKLRNAALIVGGAIAGHHFLNRHGHHFGTLKGAAAATAVVLAMPGGNVVLPKGSKLEVRFESPVKLNAK